MEPKASFIKRYSTLTDFPVFMNVNKQPLRISLRVNTLKISIEGMKKRFSLEQIPWCKEGFFVKGYTIGNTLEHFLGYIYIQEAASMIPPVVLEAQPEEFVLDISAAPGSKTTQLAAMMRNTGLLIANDASIPRLKPLVVNLERCGVSNVITTLMRGERIKGITFDRILVDAPCSGVGTIRRSPKTLEIYNPNMIKKLAHMQKKLLTNAWTLLKPGGTLVYSTCTLEPEENEAVIDHAIRTFPDAHVEEIHLPLQRSPAILEFEGTTYHNSIQKCLRIWPQDNNTEGFFVAKLTKTI